jgi:uncharacterized membrane protein (UPF0127 family)
MRLLALALLLFVAACGGAAKPRVSIQTADGAVTVRVEVADSRAERERGLMGRRELADNAGMVFVFHTDSTSAFWMKDTLIPLSIAFYAESGRIVRILDMEPCRRDPCALYDPGASYRGALEVNRGAFDRWGVREGDVLRLER